MTRRRVAVFSQCFPCAPADFSEKTRQGLAPPATMDQLADVRREQQALWRSRSSNNPSSSHSKDQGVAGDKGEADDDDDVICLSPPVQASAGNNYNDEVVYLGSSSSSGQGLITQVAGTRGSSTSFGLDDIAGILRNRRMHVSIADVVDLGSSSSSLDLSAQIAGTLRNKRKHLSVDDGFSSDECKKFTGVVAKADGFGGTYRLTDSHPRVHEDGGWLWASDPCYKKNRPLECRVDEPGDVKNLMVQFERTAKEDEAKITHDFVLELAKKHGVLHGKWLLWFSPEHVVENWTKIRNSLLNGELGPTAKISSSPEGGSHVVCVYCPDFTDSEELLRIRRGIANAGIMTKLLRYKTDAFTYLGIYADNKWKLRTTSFDCGGKNDPKCKVLSYAGEKTCSGQVGCKKCFPCCLVVQEENEAKMAEEEKKRRALVKPLFPSWSQIDTRRAKPKFTFADD